MKISDFYAKNTEFRPQNTQILAFNNEVKETQLESKIAFLDEKTAKMNEIAEEMTLLGKQLKEQRDSFMSKDLDVEADEWLFENAAAEQSLNDLYNRITFDHE